NVDRREAAERDLVLGEERFERSTHSRLDLLDEVHEVSLGEGRGQWIHGHSFDYLAPAIASRRTHTISGSLNLIEPATTLLRRTHDLAIRRNPDDPTSR